MDLLDQLLQKDKDKSNEIQMILNKYKGHTLKWHKSDRCFYILSKSTKKEGFQLTYFINNKPVSDRIRSNYLDDDFIEDLVVNNCELEKVF